MSVRAFAATFGMLESTFRNYDSGRTEPGIGLLIRLRNERGVDLNWLATGEEANPGPLDLDMLRQIIQAVEEEVQNLDAESKSRLIARLYRDRISSARVGSDADAAPSAKTAS